MTHDHSLKGTEGLLSTYRHHRHRQLGLFEALIVFRILGERGKLSEPRPHSTGWRISGGEKIPSSLVGLTRIAGKVIPNPVEVDTLPACHQPFGIRSMKVEVPNSGILENLGPGVNARNWRVHNHQPLNLIGLNRGFAVSNHVPT